MQQTMGEIICELRTNKGWTQSQLAERMGISRVAITKMENGHIKMTAARLQQLATIFAVPPGHFFPKHDTVSSPS